MTFTRRRRIWLTAAVVAVLGGFAPLMLILGKTAVLTRTPPRRALVFEAPAWRAEAGERRLESNRGLMVPGLLATGQLAGRTEAEVLTLLGAPDCPPAPGGPFAGSPRLAYWVGIVGSAKVEPGAPPPPPACLYLHLIDGRVVEWQAAPAPRVR